MPSDDFDLREFTGITRLFPLPGVVLFPHVVLPLHIFEPRYRQMTEHALAGDRLVTIVQVRPDATWSGTTEPAIEPVACLGRILDHERLPDGRFHFLLLGRKRVRIVRELATPTLYRQAEVEVLDDLEPAVPDPGRRAELVGLFRGLVGGVGAIDPDLERLLDAELCLGVLTDILAHALGLPPAVKQQFLAERRVERRADSLIHLMRQLRPAPGSGPARRRPYPYPPPVSPN